MADRDQRGLSGSVQLTLLFPLAVLVLLATLQWSLLLWAEAVARAAAQDSAGQPRPLGVPMTTDVAKASAPRRGERSPV